ncbi:BNR/Asp-box repeat protein [bacterium BMS3Abin03]|nr:BNR/Asp-box repeat protein [bacterium BMS3Abin03]
MLQSFIIVRIFVIQFQKLDQLVIIMVYSRIILHFVLFFLISNFNLFGQYQNVRVDGPQSYQPEEVTIAINPVNPNILAGGANIDNFYYSSDGGFNWGESFMSSTLGVWGDPCVLFDSLGNLYYGHLSNPASGYWIDRIVIQKSTDYGQTWNDGAGIGFLNPKNQDKEWLAVDLTQSQYKGNIYVTWTEFDDYGSSNPNDSSRIRFSKSLDQGETWSDAITISDRSGDCIDSDNTTEGAVPAVGPNGEIYVSWAGPLGLMFDKSVDGGETWGTDIFVSDIPGGWDFNVPGIYRCNGLPITMCDISNSPHQGNIYICWGDQRNGSNNTDVFISRSTDGGETWSTAMRVNDDNTTRHQFFPWMTVDQKTGNIWAVFYDRRNTTGSATDVYVARSTDGGETFDNFKVSESSFTPTSGVFFGDYINIAAWNKEIRPIWMRLQSGVLTVWTAIIQDSTTVPVELTNFNVTANSGEVLLEWQTATETNNLGFEIERAKINALPENGNPQFYLIGYVPGNGTSTSPHDYNFLDKNIVSGIYQYRLKQIDFDGYFEYSDVIEVNFIAADDFRLAQNYPNPFNPSTTISYQLPEATYVTLKVYDILGNEVETLVNGLMPAGVHEVNFNASNLSSGVYLYRIDTEKLHLQRKMLLTK